MADQGLVTGVAGGVILLVILVIVGFVVIQEIGIVEDSLATSSGTKTVFNETGGRVNDTPYTLSWAYIDGFTNPIIYAAWNGTELLTSGNITVTDAGVVTNASDEGWEAVNFTYSFDYKETTVSTKELRSNFTTGITKVSNKLPTVLLIIAVVLILGVLVLLWSRFRTMQMVGGAGATGEL